MLKLDKKTRDEIVAYLTAVVVPAYVGANLKAIADVLSKLEEIKEEEKK